jgi:hypothetical protein
VKQKRQVGILLILIMIAAVVWLFNLRGKPVVTADAPTMQENDPIRDFENPQIRMDEIKRAQKTEYKSSGRNPFSPAPPPQPHLVAAAKPREIVGPQPKPPDPPLPPLTLPTNLKFYGFDKAAKRRAFLTDGEEVYVVAEGEVFLKRFRILRIGNASLEFEEIGTGRTGSVPLIEEPAGGPTP